MMRFRYLVLLVVLGALCTATATAQAIMTPGQMEAEHQFALCGHLCEYGSTDATAPAFVASSFGVVSELGQVRSLVVLLSEGDKVYIRRQIVSDSYFYEPGTVKVMDTDELSSGDEPVYTILRIAPDGTKKIGFSRTFILRIPDGAAVGYNVESVKSSFRVAQPCEGLPIGAKCPMIYETVPNRYRFTGTGELLPDKVYVLPIGRDGSVGKPAEVKVTDGGFSQEFGRFTGNRTGMSLVVCYSEIRVCQTISDVGTTVVTPTRELEVADR